MPISGLVPGCLYLDLYLFVSKKEVLRPKRGLAFKLMPQSEAFYLDPTPVSLTAVTVGAGIASEAGKSVRPISLMLSRHNCIAAS